jgi:hypothetical protein
LDNIVIRACSHAVHQTLIQRGVKSGNIVLGGIFSI